MSKINEIRESFEQEKKVSQIARELEVDEKTVRKYLKQENFSLAIPIAEERISRLDSYKLLIQQWMDGDITVWYKQRHTAQRIYDRLKVECPEFDLSYPTVQRFVKEYKRKLQQTKTFQELVWHSGEAQVDFGEADFYEQGVLCRKKYLTVSFPYSNRGFYQVFGGEKEMWKTRWEPFAAMYLFPFPPLIRLRCITVSFLKRERQKGFITKKAVL
jgi:transposase